MEAQRCEKCGVFVVNPVIVKKQVLCLACASGKKSIIEKPRFSFERAPVSKYFVYDAEGKAVPFVEPRPIYFPPKIPKTLEELEKETLVEKNPEEKRGGALTRSPETYAKILKMRLEGCNISDISRKTGVPRRSVEYFLKKAKRRKVLDSEKKPVSVGSDKSGSALDFMRDLLEKKDSENK